MIHFGAGLKYPDPAYPPILLRIRRERPEHRRRGCCATDAGDEFPPPHSITSSASASTSGDRLKPSAFAVCRLTTNLNLVGNWTGRSPGFAPFKMRST